MTILHLILILSQQLRLFYRVIIYQPRALDLPCLSLFFCLIVTVEKFLRSLIIEAKASIEKAKSDAIRASSTMEKRRKLESRFIHQIGELQKQIVDNNFTIASLEILTSKAKVESA